MLTEIVSSNILKVNYSPYLVDLVLHGEVDSFKHKAAVKDGVLNITLMKKDAQIWNKLEEEVDKHTLMVKKQEAMQSHLAMEEQLSTQRTDRKIQDERHAVRQQMALDEAERTHLETLQADEKKQAEKEVYDTFAKMQQAENNANNAKKVSFANTPTAASNKAITSSTTPSNTATTAPTSTSTPTSNASSINNKMIHDESDIVNDYDMLEDLSDEEDHRKPETDSKDEDYEKLAKASETFDEDIRYIPPPRNTSVAVVEEGEDVIDFTDAKVSNAKVTINFTPRVFPTPMRESKAAEEEDWIAKNRRHLKHHGVLNKGLKKNSNGDVSEEDPVWLKAKGDDFFRTGDVRSAINAYSAALDADPEFVACYSNRAICYLQMTLYAQCKLDCDKAIELIHPQVSGLSTKSTADAPSSAEDIDKQKLLATLVKLYIRRGSALCSLGQFQESLSDYCQALVKFQQLPVSISNQSLPKVTPPVIQNDIDRLKLLVVVETSKKEADSLIGERKLEEALTKYNTVLSMIPIHVSALSNRAGCKMALNDIEGAIADCTTAIEVLTFSEQAQSIGGNESIKNMLSAILPPANSDKRKQWLLKTVLRKAAALVQLDHIPEAIEQYEQAIKLDPGNVQIRTDHEKLQALFVERTTTKTTTSSNEIIQ